MSAGKGDRRRPYDREKWERGYRRTFGEEECPDLRCTKGMGHRGLCSHEESETQEQGGGRV